MPETREVLLHRNYHAFALCNYKSIGCFINKLLYRKSQPRIHTHAHTFNKHKIEPKAIIYFQKRKYLVLSIDKYSGTETETVAYNISIRAYTLENGEIEK